MLYYMNNTVVVYFMFKMSFTPRKCFWTLLWISQPKKFKSTPKDKTNFQRVHTLSLCISFIWKEFLLLISTKYIYHFSWKFCLFYKMLKVCRDDNLFYWFLLFFTCTFPICRLCLSTTQIPLNLPIHFYCAGQAIFFNFSYWIKKKKKMPKHFRAMGLHWRISVSDEMSVAMVGKVIFPPIISITL